MKAGKPNARIGVDVRVEVAGIDKLLDAVDRSHCMHTTFRSPSTMGVSQERG